MPRLETPSLTVGLLPRTRLLFAPLLAERARGDGRRVAPLSPGGERRREPCDEAADSTDAAVSHGGSLKQARDAHAPLVQTLPRPREGVELESQTLARLPLHRPVLIRCARGRPFRNLRAQVQEQFRDVYLHGADLAARAAQARRVRQLRGLLQARQLRRDDRADGAGVDRAVGVAADLLIDGARVQACAAAYARERLARDRVAEHAGAPVVHQNDVYFLGAFVAVASLRARDERLVGRQSLARAGARQEL